jgi:transcription elongation factor GreA
VEYNALIEKQATLELTISKLDDEMKKAKLLNRDEISTDAVGVGTRVLLRDAATGEERDYTILGPWDADFEKRILSYRSPIAKALLGAKKGETIHLDSEEGRMDFIVGDIRKYEA